MACNKSMIRLIVVLLCVTVLGGCWDAKELDDLSIPLVAAYDYVLEEEKEYPDDKYLITVGIPVFYKDVEEKFHVIKTTGEIIGEARGKRNSRLGEQVIYGQLQLLLFGEELGKRENLLKLTDIITRNPKVKASIFVVVVKGRAADVVSIKPSSYPNSGIYLKALMENSKDTNFYPYTTLFQFNRCLTSYDTSALLPNIVSEAGEIKMVGSCLIHDGKISAELGREETVTAVMLRGIECRGSLSYDVLEGGKRIGEATFEGANSRKVKVRKDGEKYIFDIQIMLNGAIVEFISSKKIQGSIDLVKAFEGSLEKYIEKQAQALIEKTQKELKFDALYLTNYLKAHSRKKLTKADIDRIIRESEINVNVMVKVNIENFGGKL